MGTLVTSELFAPLVSPSLEKTDVVGMNRQGRGELMPFQHPRESTSASRLPSKGGKATAEDFASSLG